MDILLSLDSRNKHLISSIYATLCVENLSPLNIAKCKWESELGCHLSDDYWDEVIRAIHSASICARHGLTQSKIVFRAHYTWLRLSRIYPGTSDECLRCGLSPADHFHTFIMCPRLNPFWSGIFETINAAYNMTFSFNPLLALFGVSPQTLAPRRIAKVFSFCTLLARRLIFSHWKNPRPPPLIQCHREVWASIKLEKLRFSLQGSLASFEATWKPLLKFLDLQIPNSSPNRAS